MLSDRPNSEPTLISATSDATVLDRTSQCDVVQEAESQMGLQRRQQRVNGVAEQTGSNRITFLGTLLRGVNLRAKKQEGGLTVCWQTEGVQL